MFDFAAPRLLQLVAERLAALLQTLQRLLLTGIAGFQPCQLGVQLVLLASQPGLLFLQFAALAMGAAQFAEQPLVVAVELEDFLLADDQRLLALAQLDLQLLHLRLVAALLLFALGLHRSTVMLQRLAGVAVLVLQRGDLPLALLQADALVALQLIEAGQLQLLLVQAGLQLLRFRLQRRHGLLLLRRLGLQLGAAAALLFQLVPQAAALLGEGGFGGLQGRVGLDLQPLGQAGDQCAQFVAEAGACIRNQWAFVVQLPQIAMNGGLRAGIAQLDAHRVDARVLAASKQRLPRLVNQCLVDAAACHVPLHRFRTVLHITKIQCKYGMEFRVFP